MNMLDRKLWRDFGRSWKTLMAVASIIAFGIGCYTGMLGTSRNLERARDDYYVSTRFADFWIDLKKAPEVDALRCADIPGIAEVRALIRHEVICDLDGVDEPVGGLMVSMPEDPQSVINNIVMKSGSYFTPSRRNEVIVGEQFATVRGLSVGDHIAVIMDGRREELVIVGTAISAEFVYLTSPGSLVDEPGTYGLFFVKQGFAEDSFGFEAACNSLVGILTPDMRDNEAPIRELADRLSEYGVYTSIPRSRQFSNSMLTAELENVGQLAFTFPLLFMIVAGLVLNVLMTRLVSQQRSNIGTLKAIGYTTRQLFFHYLKLALVTGIVGGVLGCMIGWILSSTMLKGYVAYFSFPRLDNQIYWLDLFTGVTISVVVCLLGAVRGVRAGIRLEPADAMRPPSPSSGKPIFLERWSGFWNRLDIQWQMVLRNLVRQRSRSIISVISSMLGASIVVLAFGFVDSTYYLVSQQFERTLLSDYHLTLNQSSDEVLLDEVARLPGVTYVEPVFSAACTFLHDNHRREGGVTGIRPGSRLTVPLDDQDRPVAVPPSGLLMPERLMEKLKVKVGDQLDVLPVRGSRGRIPMLVAGSYRSSLGLQVFADQRWLNSVVGENKSVTEARVLVEPNEQIRREFNRELKRMPQLGAVTDIGKQKKAFMRQLNGSLQGMATVMIFFAAVIFFGSILNATLIGISERKNEIATFSAMGYFNHEISKSFLRENMLTTVLGTLLGLPFGYYLLISMMKAFEQDSFSITASLSPYSLAYTMILAIIFVLVAQFIVDKNIRQIDKVESLSSRE